MKERVRVKADALTDAQLAAAHFEAVDDITAAVEAAGDDATICVLPEGPQTIPFIS